MMGGIRGTAPLQAPKSATAPESQPMAKRSASEADVVGQDGDVGAFQPAVFEIPAGSTLEDVQMPMIQEIGGRGGQSGGGGSGTV